MITASIKQHTDFQLSQSEKDIVLISNGMGITSFLENIDEDNRPIKTHLFWEGPTVESFKIYSRLIDKAFYNKTLSGLYTAFSEEQSQRKYVQNLVSEKADLICRVLKSEGTIIVCGSTDMKKRVLNTLNDITNTALEVSLNTYEKKEQIKTDYY